MDAAEVKIWRRGERERLLAQRMALSPAVRRAAGEKIAAGIQEMLAERPGALGVYWPFRGSSTRAR